MLLRESGKRADRILDLNVVTGAKGEVGVKHESELLAVSEAVFKGDRQELARIRDLVEPVIGAQALADAIGVASAFNGITKIANATGLPLDDTTVGKTVEMRKETGIDDYTEQHKVALFE